MSRITKFIMVDQQNSPPTATITILQPDHSSCRHLTAIDLVTSTQRTLSPSQQLSIYISISWKPEVESEAFQWYREQKQSTLPIRMAPQKVDLSNHKTYISLKKNHLPKLFSTIHFFSFHVFLIQYNLRNNIIRTFSLHIFFFLFHIFSINIQ